MRSYQSHLSTLLASEASKAKQAKAPVLRSSALFPLILAPKVSARLLFLGYWQLKREIDDLRMSVTLRSQLGESIAKRTEAICEAKAYEVEIGDLLHDAGYTRDTEFLGSIEIEFTSSVDLVFPFPAVMLNYYNASFSTFVHTAQRVYNDEADYHSNAQVQVPESGFNIYHDEDTEAFVSLVNGPQVATEQYIYMRIYNLDGEYIDHTRELPRLPPYQHFVLWPGRELELGDFLKGSPGTMKLSFRLPWVYPRLVPGNRDRRSGAMSITHSYYDCSHAHGESDFWSPSKDGWHDAALMVPVYADEGMFTRAYFYPIYADAPFELDVEFYSDSGKHLGTCEHAISVAESHMHRLNLSDLYRKIGNNTAQFVSARILAHPSQGDRLPTRLKMGLDVGHNSSGLPCNICTNLQPYNPDLENKPRCFRWAPFFADAKAAQLWVINSSPAVNYTRSANITLTFYRKDAQTLVRTATLAPYGHLVISSDDKELREFFGASAGWCTVTADNPHVSTYTFSHCSGGNVGGDHGF